MSNNIPPLDVLCLRKALKHAAQKFKTNPTDPAYEYEARMLWYHASHIIPNLPFVAPNYAVNGKKAIRSMESMVYMLNEEHGVIFIDIDVVGDPVDAFFPIVLLAHWKLLKIERECGHTYLHLHSSPLVNYIRKVNQSNIEIMLRQCLTQFQNLHSSMNNYCAVWIQALDYHDIFKDLHHMEGLRKYCFMDCKNPFHKLVFFKTLEKYREVYGENHRGTILLKIHKARFIFEGNDENDEEKWKKWQEYRNEFEALLEIPHDYEDTKSIVHTMTSIMLQTEMSAEMKNKIFIEAGRWISILDLELNHPTLFPVVTVKMLECMMVSRLDNPESLVPLILQNASDKADKISREWIYAIEMYIEGSRTQLWCWRNMNRVCTLRRLLPILRSLYRLYLPKFRTTSKDNVEIVWLFQHTYSAYIQCLRGLEMRIESFQVIGQFIRIMFMQMLYEAGANIVSWSNRFFNWIFCR